MKADELLRVQHYEAVGKEGTVRLTKTVPYVCLNHGRDRVYIKGGSFYGEGGHVVDPVPEWVWEAAAKLSPEARDSVKLVLPSATRAEQGQVTPRVEVMNTWSCPQCDETMPTKKKGVHIAAHRRKERQPEVAGRI